MSDGWRTDIGPVLETLAQLWPSIVPAPRLCRVTGIAYRPTTIDLQVINISQTTTIPITPSTCLLIELYINLGAKRQKIVLCNRKNNTHYTVYMLAVELYISLHAKRDKK